MSGVIQVRGQMCAGQHDAVMAFIDGYSKKFANKLLLKVCESLIVTYKPKLSLFVPFPESMMEDTPPRFVYFQLSKSEHPRLTAFYKGLPHGSRQQVFINLLNHYAQLIEGDHALLESVYWSESDPAAGPVEPGYQPLPVPIVEYESTSERSAGLCSSGISAGLESKVESAPKATVEAATIQPANDPEEDDPLALLNVGL